MSCLLIWTTFVEQIPVTPREKGGVEVHLTFAQMAGTAIGPILNQEMEASPRRHGHRCRARELSVWTSMARVRALTRMWVTLIIVIIGHERILMYFAHSSFSVAVRQGPRIW